MKYKIFLPLFLLVISGKRSLCQESAVKNVVVKIRFEFDQSLPYDSISVQINPMINFYEQGVINEKRLAVVKGKSSYVFNINKPVYINAADRIAKEGKIFFSSFVEPGDDILFHVGKNGVSYSGTNISKYLLQARIKQISIDRKTSNDIIFTRNVDFEDYQKIDQYLNEKLYRGLALVDSMRSDLSEFAFNQIRIQVLQSIQNLKVFNWTHLFFTVFVNHNQTAPENDIRNLTTLFDAGFNLSELVWLRNQPAPEVGDWGFVMQKIRRDCLLSSQWNVLAKDDNEPNFLMRKYMMEYIPKIYKGMAMESCMANFISSGVIHDGALEVGFSPAYDTLINKYYNGPFDETYKKYVKERERADREYGLRMSGYHLNSYFSLPDCNNSIIDYQSLKGKVVYIRFWASGFQPDDFETVYNRYKNDNNVVLLNINFDSNKTTWLASMKQNNYLRPGIINLYTQGMGKAHPLVNAFLIDSFPQLALSNTTGWISRKNSDNVMASIDAEVSKTYDGPYVIRDNSKITAWYINNDKVKMEEIGRDGMLKVTTDKPGEYFTVKLKKEIISESSEYVKPVKLLALSDIEGEFEAFRKLLQTNGVIDESFNWTFGAGHLVLAGDMLDRGKKVTECLWLIYALEEKAKAAGGYVHYILGNHEIMNLSGDVRYVQNKYLNNARLLDKDYVKDLYGDNSELGKWLRSKNIVEKIGDLLFVHGGISEEVNGLLLSPEKMNTIVRPYYSKESVAKRSSDRNLSLLYNSNFSPFWFRQYYQEDSMKISIGPKGRDTTLKTPIKVIDGVLSNYTVKHIITGHTIIKELNNPGKYISAHYNGKVINTDTRHAKGYSEALLIDNDQYYRVDKEGNKTLLFKSDNIVLASQVH